MIRFKRGKLSGWGRYPVQECSLYRPESFRDLKNILTSKTQRCYISHGLGRSYGDAPLNEGNGVILQTGMNGFIAFDEPTGILECQSGVSLGEIIQYFLPKGYFLPTTPGTKFVTVGGALANDVHGKNHHRDGCFSEFVQGFQLMIASGEVVECSRDKNAELFWATIGGIGLTGIILKARVKLLPVDTAYINVHYQRASNIEELLALFSEGDEAYKYSVAWIDCLARGKSLGRSVLMRGNPAAAADLPKGLGNPLSIKEKKILSLPFHFPSFALNRLSVKCFNAFYYSLFSHNQRKLVGYDSFFYPLDAVANWNRMYGKRGFVQYQAVFPAGKSREGLTAMLEKLSQSKRSSFLGVIKSSGEQSKGLLSFPIKGHTLALDIPIKDASLFHFINALDEIVVSYGGRVYLAKDSVLSPEYFNKMYSPGVEDFKRIKKEVDPANLFSSSAARRVGLVED